MDEINIILEIDREILKDEVFALNVANKGLLQLFVAKQIYINLSIWRMCVDAHRKATPIHGLDWMHPAHATCATSIVYARCATCAAHSTPNSAIHSAGRHSLLKHVLLGLQMIRRDHVHLESVLQ